MCEKTSPASVSLAATEEAPARARSAAGTCLCLHHAADARAAVSLLTSELVTDAVMFGAPPIEISLECRVTDYLVTVTDGGSLGAHFNGRDGVMYQGAEEPHRELSMLIIDKVARDWGIESRPGGRNLWCVVPTGTLEA
jgi:hypothetical protein